MKDDTSRKFDLGNLQNSGFIKELDDLSACPNCSSKNIAWKFFIPMNGSKPTGDSLTICQDCGYKDKKGEFEKTNKSILRDKKINQIIDGLQ